MFSSGGVANRRYGPRLSGAGRRRRSSSGPRLSQVRHIVVFLIYMLCFSFALAETKAAINSSRTT